MHKYWTPRGRNLFLALALGAGLSGFRAHAQDIQNTQENPVEEPDPRMTQLPSGMSGDFSGIGGRAGRPTTMHFFGGVTGIFDNQLQPLTTDAKGNLINVGALWGVSASIGASGTHVGKRYGIQLDYRGLFNHYTNNSRYDGSDHALVLGYRYQFTRHVLVDLTGTGGTYVFGTGAAANLINGQGTAAPQLLDNRMNYIRSGASLTWLASSRMSYRVSANGFYQAYQAGGLGSSHGYTLSGNVSRRLTRRMDAGFEYDFARFLYPSSASDAATHSFQATFSTRIPGRWTFSLAAGASKSESTSPLVDPFLSALFGRPIVFTVYTNTWFPSGSVRLAREFRRSNIQVVYARGISSGDGLFYTSRRESVTGGYSFAGTRKMSLGVDGGYFNSVAVNQASQKYTYYTAGAGFTYHLYRSVNWTGRLDYRRQDANIIGLKTDGVRVAVGLAFSSDSLPLGLW